MPRSRIKSCARGGEQSSASAAVQIDASETALTLHESRPVAAVESSASGEQDPLEPSVSDNGQQHSMDAVVVDEQLTGWALACALFAASIGNFLEWMDFALFGMFADQIAATFFPKAEATVQLIQAFLVYGSAFLMRPLGGVLFGYIADKRGRVRSMQLSIILMAIPTAALAVLPGYSEIGWLSTVLLVAIRLLQGLSVGGQFSSMMTYAMEVCPVGRRGFVGALTQVTASAIFGSSAIAAALHAVLTEDELVRWGWRIPFGASLVVGLFGFWLRLGLADPVEYTKSVTQAGRTLANPLLTALQHNRPEILRIFLVVKLYGAGYYLLFVYLPALLTNAEFWCEKAGCIWQEPGLGESGGGSIGGYNEARCVQAGDRLWWQPTDDGQIPSCSEWVRPVESAYAVNSVAIALFLLIELLFGLLSDYIGSPTPFVQGGAFAVGLLSTPCFYLFGEGSMEMYALGLAMLGAALACYVGPLTWWIVDACPDPATRAITIGIAYNLSASLDGFAPALAVYIASRAEMLWIGFLILTPFAMVAALFGPGQPWHWLMSRSCCTVVVGHRGKATGGQQRYEALGVSVDTSVPIGTMPGSSLSTTARQEEEHRRCQQCGAVARGRDDEYGDWYCHGCWHHFIPDLSDGMHDGDTRHSQPQNAADGGDDGSSQAKLSPWDQYSRTVSNAEAFLEVNNASSTSQSKAVETSEE